MGDCRGKTLVNHRRLPEERPCKGICRHGSRNSECNAGCVLAQPHQVLSRPCKCGDTGRISEKGNRDATSEEGSHGGQKMTATRSCLRRRGGHQPVRSDKSDTDHSDRLRGVAVLSLCPRRAICPSEPFLFLTICRIRYCQMQDCPK